MMRIVCVVLIALLAFGVCAVPLPLPSPIRFPVSSTAATTYSVPYGCGVQIFTGASASTWTLPLSYTNSGNVSNGQMLWIRNTGTATVTASATSPDTIHGGNVAVTATSVAQLVMNNGVWVVLTTATSLQ